MALEREARRVRGVGQGVVHEGAGHQLPVLVICGRLHQRLADALHDAAVRLALHQHRVDQHAEVVDHVIAHHRGDAGFRIDLDLRHVAAVGEG